MNLKLQEITSAFSQSKQFGTLKENIALVEKEAQDVSDVKTKLEK